VPSDIEHIKILAGENVPIAFEKRASQMLWQRFERTAILGIVCVNWIVVESRANEVVVGRIVDLRAIKSSGRRVVYP